MAMPKLRFKNSKGKDYPKWEISHLNQHCLFLSGLTYKPSDVVLNDGIIVLRSANIQNSLINYKDIVMVRKDMSFPNLEKNDILICSRNGSASLVGKTALISDKDIHNTWGAFMMIIRPSQENHFLYQYFKTDLFKKEMQKDQGTSTINQITKSMLDACLLYIPSSLEEQEKIAFFLTELDNLISASDDEVKALEDMKKGYMQKIFSQEIRFTADDGSEYPEWEFYPMREVCEYVKKGTNPFNYPNDYFYEYSMPAYDEGKQPCRTLGKTMSSSRIIVSEPVVLFNKLNVRKKRIWNVETVLENSVCSSEFLPIRSNKLQHRFLTYWLNTDIITEYVKSISTGTSNSQKRISPDGLMDADMAVPCLEEQQKIADFFTALDVSIETAKQELEQYRQLKKAMLQQLFV